MSFTGLQWLPMALNALVFCVNCTFRQIRNRGRASTPVYRYFIELVRGNLVSRTKHGVEVEGDTWVFLIHRAY